MLRRPSASPDTEMDSQSSPDPLDALIPPPDFSAPTTPELPHATISDNTSDISKAQASRIHDVASHLTPPPSTQVPSSNRIKARTPTPPVSHISTPPPTDEGPILSHGSRLVGGLSNSLTNRELANVSADDLRLIIAGLQSELQEAKMSAAHHKLQYQMLAQESAAAIERMAVEARMEQHEHEVIHSAEQAKVAATPVQLSSIQEGMVPVQKDLYQRMCREIQMLSEVNHGLENESEQQHKFILRQDSEIASLTDKVTLMRERIRENREHLRGYRVAWDESQTGITPRSIYSTPRRPPVSSREQQPFAALLQASEMASQESARSGPDRTPGAKKGHTRNIHSTSSLPSTPHRMFKDQTTTHRTPQDRLQQIKIPSTAPLPRTSAMRVPDVYSNPTLPVQAPPSEGTVTASDNYDNDSEAETDIIEPDDEIGESHASRAASQMLRSSQEQQAKRDSFKGSGMLTGHKLKQTRLFGAIRKPDVDRREGPPNKRARTGEAVGLGIAGVRQ